MKLHLPLGLRKTLVACLAIAALPTTLPSTLASASGIAAAMFLFASQRAAAEALTWSSENSYTIRDEDNSKNYDSLTLTGETGVVTVLFQTADNTLTISGWVSSGQAGVDLRLCDDSNHNKGTVVFQGGGEIKGTLVLFDNATVKIGAELSVGALGGNGFNIQATGDQDVILNITGGATGGSSKDALGAGQGSAIGEHIVLKIGQGVTQKISGVKISGTVDLNGANAVLSSTNVIWGCNEDTMSGKLTGNGTLQVVGGSVGSFEGASHTLHWSGDSSSFTGRLEVKTGGILDMSTNMHAGSLTLRDQSEIRITGGTLSVGEITLDGNDASITIARNESSMIDFSDITGGRLTINLSGFTESGTFQLFGSQFIDWFSEHREDWNDYITFSGVSVGQKVTLSTDQTGSIVISSVQTHVFSGESLTWQEREGGWTSGGTWVNGDSAEFSADAGEHAVTLDGDVTVAGLRVTTVGATYNFTGTGTLTIEEYANAGSSGSPEVDTTMTFGEGVNVHLTGNFINHGAKSAYTFKERLVVDGRLSLWGAPNNEGGASVMTLEKGAEVGELDASWAGKFVLGGDLVVKSWIFDGGNGGGHFTWFEKMAEVEGNVYVDVQTSMTLSPSGGGATLSFGSAEAGTGVGLKVSGRGNTLTVTTGDWNIGGNLAATEGGNLTLQPGSYTIGGSLFIGAGSTVHGLQGVTIKSSVTLSDGAILKFGNGNDTTRESIIEGKVTDGDGYGTLLFINADVTLSDDVVLKGVLQFGWGHTEAATSYIKLKKGVEVGSLLLDLNNHSMHFKKTDETEGDVYVILNLSEEEGHASQLGNSNSPSQISDGVLTYTDEGFLALFEEGVVFGVKGDGKKLSLGGGGEMKGGLFVDAGATLELGGSGLTWSIKGAINGEGQLNVYNSPVVLEKGGSIGKLLAGWDDASIVLGDDLEIGGWGWDNGNTNFRFKKKEEAEGSPVVIFKKDEGVDFTCGNNWGTSLQDGGDITQYVGWLTTGENEEDKIRNGVGLGKSGTGKLKVGNNRADVVRIYGDVVILGGELQMGDDCGILVHGKLRGEVGTTLTIQTGSGTTAEEDVHCLELKGGGDYDGLLSMSQWGGQIKIGADLTVGGMTEDAPVNTGYNRKRMVDSSDETDRSFILDVAQASYSVEKVRFGEHINLVKKGEGKQMFREATVGGDVTVEAGELAFSATEGMTIGGVVSITGGTMGWSGGTLTITGQLSSSSGGTLSVAYGENTRLTLTGGVGETLSLTLTGLTYDVAGGDGWELFGESWSDEWKDKITVNGFVVNGGQRYRLKIDESTHHIVLGEQLEVESLTWTSGGADDVLNWSRDSEWDSSKTFEDYDNVTLAGGSTGGKVQMSRDVVAGNLTVTGSDGIISLRGTGTLNVDGSLKVENGATLSVGGSVTLQFGSVSESGSEGKMEVTSDGVIKPTAGVTITSFNGAGGTIDLSALSGEREEDRTLAITTLTFTPETMTTVSLGASGVLSTSAQVEGSGADLIIDTGEQGNHSTGALGLKMTGGGTLGSLQCRGLAGGAWVTAELNGEWTLEKESNLGNLQMNSGTDLRFTLGADFTLNGFGAVGWGSGGTKLEIFADKDGVDFIYDCQFSDREIWFHTTSGSLKIGSEEHAVDFVVNHTSDASSTAFGVPTFSLTGNLEIRQGILKFYSTSAGIIEGHLSGAGTLSLTNSTFTIGKDGSAGSIGALDFRGAGNAPTSTVKLVGDLVVKSITSTTSEGVAGEGILQKAEEATAANVYLLIDTGAEVAEETTGEFVGRYEHITSFGEGTGMGKAGSGELKLSAAEGAETMATPFKLAAGTLTWTGGTQEVSDFTAVSGTTLNVTGGNLQLGTFSGEITNLKLSGSGVLTVGGGVLTVGSLEVSDTAAKLEIDAAGNAQIKLVSAGIFSNDGGKLTIDVRNVTGAHYQLFNLGDAAPNWWTEWYEQYDRYVSIVAGGVSDVHLNEDGSIDIIPSDGVTWVGGGDNNTWSNESDAEWKPNLQPNEQHVHFVRDTGEETHEGTVRIDGTVTPHNVYIDGGTYTFVNAETGRAEGGLNIAEGGMLQVSEGATLHLNLKNTSIPIVDLQGTLGLGHTDALPVSGTKLQFNGGTLLYDTKGVATDVSSLVDQENSAGHVKVQVEAVAGGVTWGDKNSEANSGVSLALDSGLDKRGTGDFTLAWHDRGTTVHAGEMKVGAGGKLIFDVAADGIAQLTGGVEVDDKGELALQVDFGSLSLSGDISGDGKLSVSQGTVSLSGRNSIKKIELGNGTTTIISGDYALGGAETALTLSGGTIAASSTAQVLAGKVTVFSDTTINGDITFTGTMEGSGSLSAAAGKNVELSGDISSYTGMLETEDGQSTWRLSGGTIGADGRLNANLVGKGIFEVRGDSDVFLGGLLGRAGDSFTLKNVGGGELVITSDTDVTGVSLDVGTGRIVLGDTEHSITWKGQEVFGVGELVLCNVTLGEGGFTGRAPQSKLRVETAVAFNAGQTGGVVDLGGMDVSKGALSGIVVNERGQLKGVRGTITVGGSRGITVDIYLARENVGDGAKAAVVGSGDEGVTFDVKRRNSLKLHLGASAAGAIAESFQDTEHEGIGTAILYVVENGSIGAPDSDVSSYFDVSAEAQVVLDVTGARVERDEQGRIIITGSAADVYIVRDKITLEGDSTKVLEESKATLLSRETSKLHLSQMGTVGTDDDITIKNLVGVRGSELTVENQAEDAGNNRFTVRFNNTRADITQEDVMDEGKAEDVEGQDTSFYGSLTAGVGVDVEKEGLGTFTVGGNYTLKDGSTTITQGRLVLGGEENSMENLTFHYMGEPDPNGHQGDQPKAEERGLVLAGGGKTTVRGTITESTDSTGGSSDAIEIWDDSELVLTGNNTLKHTSITADDAENGGGKLTLEGEGAGLTLKGGDSQLSGVDVELKGEGSTLDVGDAKNDVASLSGNGTLKSAAGAELSVGGGSFSGMLDCSLDSSTGKAGKLVVEEDADFTLDNVGTGSDAAKAWDVQVRDGGALTIDVSKKGAEDSMTLGDVDLGSGNTTTFKVSSDTYGATTVQGNSLTWGEDSTIVLEASTGENVWDPSKGELTLGNYGSIDGNMDDLDVRLRGDAFLMSDVKGVTEKDGKVVIELKETQNNKFERAIPNGEKNSMAGAQMFWGSLKDKTQFETLMDVLSNPDSDYAKMVHGLVGLMDTGNKAEMEQALAAGAGSSLATLGPALVQDLHRQLGAIRNRTTTMANEVTYDSYDVYPTWHAWLNAEGNHHKMDSDGFAPGYTLNNWGGTVGADVDVSPATTLGFALTAMYGDLKPESADSATGDVDTTYFSAFVRTTKGAWIHTLVVSGGIADVSLDRTVNAGGVSYRTQGSTDGYAVGTLYEVGYTKLVNRRGTVAFQPVFNVEIRHAAIKGYTETGSDAGLKVDDIEQDVVTFGVGARVQSIVGVNIYNRTAIVEGRLLVKADIGDNTGVAKNALIGAATVGEVESAEVGALGIEAGVGLTIPLGASMGSVFLDATAEMRGGWTSFNATVGYRVNF